MILNFRCNLLLSTAILAYIHQTVGVELVATMNRGKSHLGSKAQKIAVFAGLALALSAPVVVPAFAAKWVGSASQDNSWLSRFTPAGVDSRLAAKMAVRESSRGGAFPFTPAGIDSQHRSTITVAARTDMLINGRAVNVRKAVETAALGTGQTLRLNNSDYQLTTARGWQAFKLPASALNVDEPRLSQVVGKGSFRLDEPAKKKPSRFDADVSVGKVGNAAPNPRGAAAAGDYAFNVGGSFKLSRRIDLTAGVRYSSERDRVDPVTSSKPDSEAVFVGTKIRF
ncbi:MAG: hypothetical protein IPL18_09595 [Sphingomonadales bacterium]|nr:hypothetical protein [Sphingomonadales bacterium]